MPCCWLFAALPEFTSYLIALWIFFILRLHYAMFTLPLHVFTQCLRVNYALLYVFLTWRCVVSKSALIKIRKQCDRQCLRHSTWRLRALTWRTYVIIPCSLRLCQMLRHICDMHFFIVVRNHYVVFTCCLRAHYIFCYVLVTWRGTCLLRDVAWFPYLC